jgi:hypothetical protein
MSKQIPYKIPSFNESSFNCPFCNAFSKQDWSLIHSPFFGTDFLQLTKICVCSHCKQYSIWHQNKMVYPDFELVEPPSTDLNQEIIRDYSEASSILQKSPRGAAALLRLALQKLCVQLGEKGKDLNNDIGNLVKRGLPSKVQESLDSLRVIGNESVHPGQIDLRDDINTAKALFKLINFIAEKMITEPKEIEDIYTKIPEDKKEQINKRDGKK